MICSFIGVSQYYIFRQLTINLIKFKIKNIIRNDCLVFNETEISKEQFFNRKFKPIHSRSQNINIFYSLIAPPQIIVNRNLVYSDLLSKINKLYFN